MNYVTKSCEQCKSLDISGAQFMRPGLPWPRKSPNINAYSSKEDNLLLHIPEDSPWIYAILAKSNVQIMTLQS